MSEGMSSLLERLNLVSTGMFLSDRVLEFESGKACELRDLALRPIIPDCFPAFLWGGL